MPSRSRQDANEPSLQPARSLCTAHFAVELTIRANAAALHCHRPSETGTATGILNSRGTMPRALVAAHSWWCTYRYVFAPVTGEHRREQLQDPPLHFVVLLIPRTLQQPCSAESVRAATVDHLRVIHLSILAIDAHSVIALWRSCQHPHHTCINFLIGPSRLRDLMMQGAPAGDCRKPSMATMPHLLLKRANRLCSRLVTRIPQQLDEQRMWRLSSLVTNGHWKMLQSQPRAAEARGFLQPQAVTWVPRIAVGPITPSCKSSRRFGRRTWM